MAREERSAGVVLFHASDDNEPRRYLLLDYGRYWDLPKGHVEPGETDEAAAVRELAEETGIAGAELIPGFRHEIRYFFRAKGALVHKTVIFFIARASRTDVTLSHEHVGFAFLPNDLAIARLGFANAKKLLEAAEMWLVRHPAEHDRTE